MSLMGQERRIGPVRNIFASLRLTDVTADMHDFGLVPTRRVQAMLIRSCRSIATTVLNRTSAMPAPAARFRSAPAVDRVRLGLTVALLALMTNRAVRREKQRRDEGNVISGSR
jgi:hypothetical protein